MITIFSGNFRSGRRDEHDSDFVEIFIDCFKFGKNLVAVDFPGIVLC